jgi:hypothetical protein
MLPLFGRIDRSRKHVKMDSGIFFETQKAVLMTAVPMLQGFRSFRFATAGRKEFGSQFVAAPAAKWYCLTVNKPHRWI